MIFQTIQLAMISDDDDDDDDSGFKQQNKTYNELIFCIYIYKSIFDFKLNFEFEFFFVGKFLKKNTLLCFIDQNIIIIIYLFLYIDLYIAIECNAKQEKNHGSKSMMMMMMIIMINQLKNLNPG
ncbi:hypothetical protein DERF_014977 [Dermatophagoides farinae]|uniref:Transmembrane protein n=1 Tax=Dermatophagoides farinae TaxID=6954 RepID=A0A922HKE5_DERFA|nr:hypothetical protein DERF_014977 [Dermatophagoides farinae]